MFQSGIQEIKINFPYFFRAFVGIFPVQPVFRNQVDGFPEKILVQNRSGKTIRFLQLSSLTQQYMVFHIFKWRLSRSINILPRMMKIERRTMIDEPSFTVTKKQIGVFKSTVDICNNRI